MRKPFRRGGFACVASTLILFAILAGGCGGDAFGPPDQVPSTPIDSIASGGVPPSRMIFSSCLVWALDNFFQDICLKSGLVALEPSGVENRVLEAESYYPDDPAWSPDGSRVAYTAYPICHNSIGLSACAPDIYVMNADGSGVDRLTISSGIGSSLPAWTSDGQRIAYVESTYLNRDTVDMRLRVMDADGSGNTTLGGLVGLNPAWSPDGTRIAYAAWDAGRSIGIHVADADGSNAHALTTGSEPQDFRPSWSPDSQRIAFTRVWAAPEGIGACQVFVIDADGSDLTQITDDPFCAHHPAWSPDGATIAYNGLEGPNRYGITLINPDGTSVRLIRPGIGWPSRVAWVPIR